MSYNWLRPELTVSQKVGIGTENPTQALEINGTAKVTSLIVDNSLTVSGNLGLGTIDSSYKLCVN